MSIIQCNTVENVNLNLKNSILFSFLGLVNGRMLNGPEVFHPSRAMTSLLLLRSLDENVIVTTVIKFPKYVACQVRDIKKLEDAL